MRQVPWRDWRFAGVCAARNDGTRRKQKSSRTEKWKARSADMMALANTGYKIEIIWNKSTLNRFNEGDFSRGPGRFEIGNFAGAKFPLERITGNFRSFGNPVRRGKRHPPEIGSRFQEFDTDLGFSLASRIHADDAAGLLLAGFRVLQDDHLTDAHRKVQTNQSAMSIDDQGVGLLASHFFIGTRGNHRDGNAQKDTLASAPI